MNIATYMYYKYSKHCPIAGTT